VNIINPINTIITIGHPINSTMNIINPLNTIVTISNYPSVSILTNNTNSYRIQRKIVINIIMNTSTASINTNIITSTSTASTVDASINENVTGNFLFYRQHCAKRNAPVFKLLRGRF